MKNHPGQLRHAVLGMDDLCTTMKVLLTNFVDRPTQAYHEFMAALVDAVRCRDTATTQIVKLVRSVDRNLDQSVPCRKQFVRLLRDVAQSVQYQVEEFELYNDLGILMFNYAPHQSDFFDDVMLTSIIQLKYNGTWYEPPLL